MKWRGRTACLFLFMVLAAVPSSWAQEIPVVAEQQFENQALADEAETEDDTWLQDMEQFRKNPVNINLSGADELKQLGILTALQIANLLSYRHLFSPLVHLYELQAVPSWDISTIRKILPFITIENRPPLKQEARKRFRYGEHSILLRLSQVLEKARGFDRDSAGSGYRGSPQRILFRYRYNYKNLLQFGWLGDKDAGEHFFRGGQKTGFDFYSFHLFARKWRAIESLALGDFTVNMGQGLIQWQSLAFKKSADVLNIKRQSAVLRPYSSSGEFNFHRGAGITVKKGKMTITGFVSLRKLSANLRTDTVNNAAYFSSFLTSGYHRTGAEIAHRNNLSQTAFGASVMYRRNRWHAAVNGVSYRFSLPLQKRPESYNRYAISGNNWFNFSLDYSYTYRNLHFFGEAAADKNLNKAFINGLLISVDPRVDLAFVHRSIKKAYQSLNSNAFTENAAPANENGLYAGVIIRPTAHWQVNVYADFFQFPWLKYLVDAPSRGRDFMVQAAYTPNKQLEMHTRFRNEAWEMNQLNNSTPADLLVLQTRRSWRTQISYRLNPALLLRNRIELVWVGQDRTEREEGFLTFLDIIYKPVLKPYAGIVRLQYFETGGYNSRVYAYENDVLYSFSIPPFFDQGIRYYLNINYQGIKKLTIWLRWAQTICSGKESLGAGMDEISVGRKTEIRIQTLWIF